MAGRACPSLGAEAVFLSLSPRFRLSLLPAIPPPLGPRSFRFATDDCCSISGSDTPTRTGVARNRRRRRSPASCQSRFRERSLGFSLARTLPRRRFRCASRPLQGVAPGLIGSQRSPAYRSGEFLGGGRRRDAGHAGTEPWRAGLSGRFAERRLIIEKAFRTGLASPFPR